MQMEFKSIILLSYFLTLYIYFIASTQHTPEKLSNIEEIILSTSINKELNEFIQLN